MPIASWPDLRQRPQYRYCDRCGHAMTPRPRPGHCRDCYDVLALERAS